MEMLLDTLRRWGVRRDVAVAPESGAPRTKQQTPSTTTKSWLASACQPALCARDLVLVLALVAALAVSISWTVWLTVLTVSPNATTNYVMSTQNYDDGSFWLLQDPPASLMVFGVTGFAIVGVGYVFVAIKLLTWFVAAKRPTARLAPAKPPLKKVASAVVASTRLRSKRVQPSTPPAPQTATSTHCPRAGPPSALLRAPPRFLSAITASMSSDTVEFLVKVVDLAIQVVWLFQQVLEPGAPSEFVVLSTAIVVANALLWTWSIATGGSRLNRVLIELVFDFLLVVANPIALLWLALRRLALDYRAFDINLEMYPAFSLQRSARVLADPVKMLAANHTIDTLRIVTVLDFFMRVGSNLSLCRRFNSVVELLKASDGTTTKRLDRTELRSPEEPPPPSDKTKRDAKILYMLLFAASVIVVSTVTTLQSQRACAPHPECAVHAHRWVGSVAHGELDKCPCRILVDVDRAPKTYEEWLSPRDVTAKVAQLAAAGTLQGIQLMNRRLEVFPDELQRSAGSLKYLAMVYTQLTALPPWFNRLSSLEYLFIQGKPNYASAGARNFEHIPADAFDDMPSLAFIQLANHPDLLALPSLQGLSNLRALTLVFLTAIQDLQGLEKLSHLERMVLMRLRMVTELPDMSALRDLRTLHISHLPVCCNGFVTGTCDVSDSFCAGQPCYNDVSSGATSTREVLQSFGASSVCPLVALCNGVLYRKCSPPNLTSEAMCFNSLSLPIWCDSSPSNIEVRRREIAAGVGTKCDPAIEAWLGCQATR